MLCLMACAGNELTYANRTFNPTPEQQAQMMADKQMVKAQERNERAERRAERREEMMNQAEAYQKATKGKTHIYCGYWGCR
ncbi:MAG: hypothetical protein J6W29_08620 [Neisseriaceae bacterium]|nr:hypothetical protein [Neisseriaceae bacterium]MBP5790278.1 hypothetical protein [Neisseriaceae bacterium]